MRARLSILLAVAVVLTLMLFIAAVECEPSQTPSRGQ